MLMNSLRCYIEEKLRAEIRFNCNVRFRDPVILERDRSSCYYFLSPVGLSD